MTHIEKSLPANIQKTLLCPCCEKEKTLSQFSKLEREKNREMRCNTCVQLMGIEHMNYMYACICCQEKKGLAEFSNRQRKMDKKRVCKDCILTGRHVVSPRKREKMHTSHTCATCQKKQQYNHFSKKERKKGKRMKCNSCVQDKISAEMTVSVITERDQMKQSSVIPYIYRQAGHEVIQSTQTISASTRAKRKEEKRKTNSVFRDSLQERDLGICHYCHQTDAATIDHKTPISKNGKTTLENCVIACDFCNAVKANMTYLQFLKVLHHFPAAKWLTYRIIFRQQQET